MSESKRRCPVSDQTPSEELVNVITHGAGVLLAIVGAIAMFEYAWTHGTALHVFTSSVYSLAWVLLFSCSTLYHYSRCLERKWRMRLIDHCAIFVVIAASYGPFMAHCVGGWRGYGMWLMAWILAAAGSAFKFRSENRYAFWAVFGYFVQGGMVLLVFPTLTQNLSTSGVLQLLFCGGLIGAGTPLYNRESIPYHHGYWHMCVLIGAISLYYCVLHSILPGPLNPG